MKGSKRAHKSSDSSDSENVTPTKGLESRTSSTANKKITKEKSSSAETVASESVLNSTLREMNPVVVLDRGSIPQSLRKSLGHGVALSPLVDTRNANEEREREERHRQRIALQRRGHHLSASTPDKRGSASNNSAQILNADQLKEHYSVCIKLSATNKITTKNAFVLHLIDYMSDFLKNTNNGRMNFKLASSTLDAGAKIYSNRVDCVHAEAQKVASGLVMALDKKGNDKGQAEDDEGEDDGVADTEAGPRPKKKKIIKHSGRTLVQNIDTINVSKIEGSVEIDPLFHHISSGFDMGSVSCLLTANLKTNDNYQLMLDSGGRINDNTSSVRSCDVSLHRISHHLLRTIHPEVKICPKIAEFVFAKRSEGSSFIPSIDNDHDSTIPDLRASGANSKTSFVFDMNAEIEDEASDDVGNIVDDLFENDNCDDFDDDEDMQRAETVARKSLIRAINLEGMMDLMKVLSDNPSEYSYFNKKLLCTWAGPQHWKANPFLKYRRNENNIQNGATTTKKTRLKKQDRQVDFAGDFIPRAEEVGQNLQLKVVTMRKWAEASENILPDDHCYDPKSLTFPFNKPCSTFSLLKSSKDIPEVSDVNTSNEHNYSVPGSPEIGDGIGCNDYDEDFPTEAYGEPGSQNPNAPVNNTGEQFPFTGDNLVAQPEAIEKIDLKYAKVAKNMDVKRLKRAMWDILTATPCNTPTVDTQGIEMTAHVSFNELYRTVPRKITPSMANNLSAPIAFVTLLHLANEKNLKLKANTEMTDFDIFQENKFSL